MKKTNSIIFNSDVSASEETRVELTNFKGVDFTNSPLLVNSNHSPNSVNMEFREGTNHKRFGFKQKAEVKVWNSSTLNYDYFPINGVWNVTNASGVTETIAHCGDKIYKLDIGANYDGFEYSVVEEIAKPSGSTIKNQKSFGVVKGNKLYILCGDYVVYTNGMLRSVSSDAYTPTTTIQISDLTSPSTAVTYEPINMLSETRINKILSRNKNVKCWETYNRAKVYSQDLDNIALSLYPNVWVFNKNTILEMFDKKGLTSSEVLREKEVIDTLIEFRVPQSKGIVFGVFVVTCTTQFQNGFQIIADEIDTTFKTNIVEGKTIYVPSTNMVKLGEVYTDSSGCSEGTNGEPAYLDYEIFTDFETVIGNSSRVGGRYLSFEYKHDAYEGDIQITTSYPFIENLLSNARVLVNTNYKTFERSSRRRYFWYDPTFEIAESVRYQTDILSDEALAVKDFKLTTLMGNELLEINCDIGESTVIDETGTYQEILLPTEYSHLYLPFHAYPTSTRYGIGKFYVFTGILELVQGIDSPQDGLSNIEMLLISNKDFGKDKITNCTIGQMFGYGELEELFVSGNPNYPNYDWHTSFVSVDDLSYFADTSYTAIGSSVTKILGYARLDNNEMAVFKEEDINSPSIYVRTSSLVKDINLSNSDISVYNTQYSISSCAIGLGALNNSCIQNLANDTLFLNKNGVYSLALSSNLKGNVRYALERSEPINNKLLKEKDLQNAVAVVFDNRYYLAVNGNVYIADARFKQQSEEMMDDTFSYEWYYWEGVNVRTWFVLNGKLAFGTDDGRICVFTNEDFVDVTTQTISSGNGEIIVYASGLSDIDVPANTIGDNFNASAIQIRDSFIPTIGDKKKVNVYQTLDYRVLQPIDCLLTRYVHGTMSGGFLKGTYNNKYCLVVYCSTFTNNGLYEKLSKLDYVYDANGFKYQVAIDMENIGREVIKLIPMYDEFHTEEMAIEVFNNKSWRYFYFKLSEVNVIKCTYGGVDYYVIQDPTKKELVEGDTYENCLANGVKLLFDFSSDEEYFIFENIEEKVVNSCWNTKFFDGGDKTLIKKIKGVYVVTGKGKFDISIDAQKKNGFVKTYAVNNLDFENVNFENFVLSSDKNLQTLFQKMAINNVNFFQVKLENNENIDSVLYCLGVITQKLERIKGVK